MTRLSLLFLTLCFVPLISMAQTGVITGRVVSEDGSGLPGMTVTLLPVAADRRASTGGSQHQTGTDLDGNFKFTELAPRVYSVSASAAKSYVPGPVPVGERQDGGYNRVGDNVTITMIKGGAITGRVTNAMGEPLIGAQVNAVMTGGAKGNTALGAASPRFTDDRGFYRIYGLAPGTYVVFTRNALFRFPSPYERDTPTYHPSSTRETATEVTVASGSEAAGVDIRHRGDRGYVVSGSVSDGDKSYSSYTWRIITLTNTVNDAVRSDAFIIGEDNAKFAIYGVADGEYEITASWLLIANDEVFASASRRVVVKGADVGGIELKLLPPGSIAGKFTLEATPGVCESKRKWSLEEALLALRPEAKHAGPAAAQRRMVVNGLTEKGEFTVYNLEANRYFLEPRLPNENCLSILALSFVSFSLQAQTREAKVGTATVTGRVTLKGEAARGVVVLLQSEEAMRTGDRSPGSRMKTDENGRFRFAGLKAGRYTLAAIAPGFVTPSENTFGLRAKAIDLDDGENLDSQEIALKRGAVITGRVTDANGKPLVEQNVELTRLDDRGQPLRVGPGFNPYANSTDDRGIYRIYGLQAGRYLVSAGFAQREGSIMVTVNRTYYQRTYHPDTTEQSQAKLVEVSEGFEATGIDIKMAGAKKTYDVFGRVVDADTGQPIAGVRMAFGSLTDGGKRIGGIGSFGNQTDAQGQFHIPGVLPGKYAVFANREQNSELYSEPVLFEIGDEDVSGLVVKMRRGGSISGVAVIEGTNDPAILSKLTQIEVYANVRSEELSSPSGLRSNIGPDGGFALRGAPSGMARLSINIRAETPRFSILRIERDGAPQREGVQINPGEHVTGVRLVIGAGTNIVRGQLSVTGGALPEGAILVVNAYRAGTEIVNGRSRQVDAAGRFTIEGLTPGEYDLKLSVFFPYGSTPETGKLTERLSKQTKAVTVGANQETQVTFVVDLTPKEGGQ